MVMVLPPVTMVRKDKGTMMIRRENLLFLPILALLAAGAGPAARSVIVDGDGMEEWQWTAARIQRELPKEIQTISYSVHGQPHTSRAIPLMAIIRRAGVKSDLQMGEFADAKMKNRFLRFVILIVGRDGYATAIDLADIMPNIGNKKAFIALDADGKPWDERHAPAELVLPDDVTPVRFIHGVAEIKLIDVSPTTQPSQ
jgi:DMSO/TMAO reductase YedYZ molybdopterin-dependent catalytic subunit